MLYNFIVCQKFTVIQHERVWYEKVAGSRGSIKRLKKRPLSSPHWAAASSPLCILCDEKYHVFLFYFSTKSHFSLLWPFILRLCTLYFTSNAPFPCSVFIVPVAGSFCHSFSGSTRLYFYCLRISHVTSYFEWTWMKCQRESARISRNIHIICFTDQQLELLYLILLCIIFFYLPISFWHPFFSFRLSLSLLSYLLFCT